MSKKWKIALVVLVVIVVFCCWYTRPRSLDALVGEGKITSITLLAQVGRVGDNGKAFIDTWQVESNGERGYVNSGLEEIFKSCQYRVSLRSLFPFPSHDKIYGKEGAPILLVSAAIENGPGFTAICRGPVVEFTIGGRTILAQAEDDEIGEKLLAYTQEFGWET